jgi:hypothetical protein
VCLTPVGLAAEQPASRRRKAPQELFASDRFDTSLDYTL